jgi:hypothetical protein
VQIRSPLQSGTQRSVILRGFVGAVIGASVIAALTLLVPMASRWLDGPARPATPDAIANIPDDTGPALAANATGSDHKTRTHAKAKAHPQAILVGGSVVILSGTDAAPASSAPTPDPAPVPTTRPAQSPTQSPAKAKAPKRAPKVVTDESNPVAPAVTAPVAANAAASTGLVRLSVQSVGIAPNAAGDPELQAKLAIQGAQPSDALPDTVTLHLRPQIPSALQSNNSAFALNASVDMVDAPRTTSADPALQMRVRMAIAAAPSGTTPTSAPVVQDPGPADGKSNVIGLTVPLASFVRAPAGGTPGEDDPTTPPDNQGPGDPGPGDQGPGDPTQQPAPGDPATPGQPTGGDPSTPPQEPAPGDPTTPGQPSGGDPTTPQQPAPGGDPTTPDQPTAGDPVVIPPIEILIPVGPVRPNEGTTTVPVDTSTPGNAPTTDQVPIVVIVEELPPDEPPVDPADGSTPVVQDPPPDVPSPPADTTDPGTTPAPDAGAGDPTVIVVSADAPPPSTNNS